MNFLHSILPGDIVNYVITKYLHQKYTLTFICQQNSKYEKLVDVPYIHDVYYNKYILTYNNSETEDLNYNKTIYNSKPCTHGSVRYFVYSKYFGIVRTTKFQFEIRERSVYIDKGIYKYILTVSRKLHKEYGEEWTLKDILPSDQTVKQIFFTKQKFYLLVEGNGKMYLYSSPYKVDMFVTNNIKKYRRKIKYNIPNLQLYVSDKYIYFMDNQYVHIHNKHNHNYLMAQYIPFINLSMYEDTIFTFDKNVISIYSIFTMSKIQQIKLCDNILSLKIIKDILYCNINNITLFYSIE